MSRLAFSFDKIFIADSRAMSCGLYFFQTSNLLLKFIISKEALANSEPLSIFFPALSIACCSFSTVRIPFSIGVSFSNETFLIALLQLMIKIHNVEFRL